MNGRIGSQPRKKFTINWKLGSMDGHELTSKIGGKPNWIHRPCWPRDQIQCKKGMQFFAQIALSDSLFPNRATDMAYIFIGSTADRYDLSRNNAIVFQTPTKSIYNCELMPDDNLPVDSLLDFDNQLPNEYLMTLIEGQDTPSSQNGNLSDDFWMAMGQPQLGGLPYMNSDSLRAANELLNDVLKWRLLFFACCDSEFPLLLPSESPTYYVFVDEECTAGRILGRCLI